MNKSERYLLFLIIFLVSSNLLWYYLGHRPLHWDSADHLSYSLDTYKTLQNSHSFASLIINLIDVSWYYPPLVYWASIPFHAIFGLSEIAGFLEILFFYILLVVSVYHIGKRIYNPQAGLFAAFCISMFPIVNQYSRDYMLDLPLAAMAAAAVYSLIRTNNFSSRNNCIKFGVMLGLGMLTKWTFILFVLPPVIYFLIEGYRRARKKIRIPLNFSLSVLTGLVIALPWYLRHIIAIFSNRLNELERGDLSFTGNLFYYFKVIPEQISLVITILLIIGISLFFRNRNFLRNKMSLYWLIGSYLLITIISFKLPRFSIALLIPLSILFSGMIFSKQNETRKKKTFTNAFASIALINFILFSFFSSGAGISIPYIDASVISNISTVKNIWLNDEVIKTIEADRIENKKEKVNLRVLPWEENFNTSTLKYYANLNSAHINVLGAEGFPLFTDYVVLLKKNTSGEDSTAREQITNKLLSGSKDYSGTFVELKKFYLPNNDRLILYKAYQNTILISSLDSLKQKIKNSAGNFFKNYIQGKLSYELYFEDSLSAVNGKIKLLRLRSGEAVIDKIIFRGIQYINENYTSSFPVPVRNFEMQLQNLDLNLSSLISSGKFEPLSLDEIRINSLDFNPSDMRPYREFFDKNEFPPKEITFENNFFNIEGKNKFNLNFRVSLSLSQAYDTNLLFKIEKYSIAGIPIPSTLINYMLYPYNPVIKGTETISQFKLGKLTFEPGKLIIRN